MKIVLLLCNNNIDDYFGYCEYYIIFIVDIKIKEIIDFEIIELLVGCGCKLNIVLIFFDMGVKVLFVGNMGEGVVRVLSNVGIEVLCGCFGDVKIVVLNWINGFFVDFGDLCDYYDCYN